MFIYFIVQYLIMTKENRSKLYATNTSVLNKSIYRVTTLGRLTKSLYDKTPTGNFKVDDIIVMSLHTSIGCHASAHSAMKSTVLGSMTGMRTRSLHFRPHLPSN